MKLIHIWFLFLIFGSLFVLGSCSSKVGKKQADSISIKAKKGEFNIDVFATGELRAKKSISIKAPRGMRNAGIMRTTISDLVKEGTVVRKGDYVGALDRMELANKMADINSELERIETQLEQVRIDTAIEMRGLRVSMQNLLFDLNEKRLEVEQSQYEPQMVIRQAELVLEKTQRQYDQLVSNMVLKKEQAIAKVSEIRALKNMNQTKLNRLDDLSNEFVIKAPADGMLIYRTSWNGSQGIGAEISPWNNTIAQLPDLDDMISKTNVNEVDIRKVQVGQDVTVKIDAFPEKQYSGTVVKIANIGQQYRNTDAKVFEVIIQLNEMDSILRPAMTTSNTIITGNYEDVVYIPIEALVRDSIDYVHVMKNGKIMRQEVVVGYSNADEIIIEHGIAENDELFMSTFSADADFEFNYLDPQIKIDIADRLAKEKKKREELMRKRQAELRDIEISSEQQTQSNIMFIG